MKKFFSFFSIALGLLLPAAGVFAQYGLDKTAEAAGLSKGNVPVLIGNVIGAGLSMVSVVFFALMIYGGIRYMTARGDEDTTKKAVNTIYAAIIGILIVLASYALTNFVFSSLGNQAATPSGGTGAAEYHCTNKTGGQCFSITQEQYNNVEFILDSNCLAETGPCP